MELKKIFLKGIERVIGDEKEIGVALSSGKDSSIIVFALLELGRKVTGYTFHVEGIESTDYKIAKKNSSILGINFVECVIPKVIDANLVVSYIEKYGRFKKVDVECMYPYYFLYSKLKERILMTGWGAGVLMPLSKKVMIHYKDDQEKYNDYRKKDYVATQKDLKVLEQVGKDMRKDVSLIDPFMTDELMEYFLKLTFKETHTPHQKQPFIDMFPDMFKKTEVLNHINLQCGDSGIREIFEPLLKDGKLNPKNRTRVIDLYRDIHERGKYAEMFGG